MDARTPGVTEGKASAMNRWRCGAGICGHECTPVLAPCRLPTALLSPCALVSRSPHLEPMPLIVFSTGQLVGMRGRKGSEQHMLCIQQFYCWQFTEQNKMRTELQGQEREGYFQMVFPFSAEQSGLLFMDNSMAGKSQALSAKSGHL